MCLIFLALDAHPEYRIVVAANRDEYYDRPSAPASFWPEAPHLLAGRDLLGGGTWLGITRSGRIAALTNYRGPESNDSAAPSRGRIVSEYLLGQDTTQSYLGRLSRDADRYNGFNLLAGDRDEFIWYSNRAERMQRLAPGVHGLSNHALDTPWPKVEKGKRELRRILESRDVSSDDVFKILSDRTAAEDETLPRTGVSLEWERILSPIFIASPGYGTRSSTVVTVNNSGVVAFREKSFDKSGLISAVRHEFMLEFHDAKNRN